MADWGGEFSFFSSYSCKNWCKKWYLHFYKTYDPQIWQAGTSTKFESNEADLAGTGDAFLSRSRDKLKTSPPPECLWSPFDHVVL